MIPRDIVVIDRVTPEEFLEYEKKWDSKANQRYDNPHLFSTGPVNFEGDLLGALLETEERHMLRNVHIYRSGTIYASEMELEAAAEDSRLKEHLETILERFGEGDLMVVAWGSADTQNRNRDRIFIHPNNGSPLGYKLSIRENTAHQYRFIDRAGALISVTEGFAPLCIARPGEKYL